MRLSTITDELLDLVVTERGQRGALYAYLDALCCSCCCCVGTSDD